ncbi:hypothetical protein CCC_03043 [Paramagnetospirillum magnetotacticum MS-1]|uniref:Uncharacterized protein n=1 Tax=Paramagnetospirillum magnetotacticum MS-1 TaxID=272627 RepID=A0A0C2YKF5_PARME|nr:hypothetical protein [Paramagnetospirillum magnetotacticum]KIM00255.1 hypothetical protein CCC_03043 [Paramagnetospirillum magnetotacticum MS-1]
MRIILALLTLLLLPLGATAQDFGRLMAQVALQPLPEGETPDIDLLLRTQWKAYYNAGGTHGFFRDQVRAGRIDLNEDGQAELFILIDSPAWTSAKGQPLLVAGWTTRGWTPIGWGFADSDSVFVTSERIDGWATILTPTQALQRVGRSYQAIDRR